METTGDKPGGRRCLPSVSYLQHWGAKPAIPSLNGPEATPRDITRPNRDIRVTRDTRERTPSRKTPIDSYSKLKARIIKN
jgi:hypothetical protein